MLIILEKMSQQEVKDVYFELLITWDAEKPRNGKKPPRRPDPEVTEQTVQETIDTLISEESTDGAELRITQQRYQAYTFFIEPGPKPPPPPRYTSRVFSGIDDYAYNPIYCRQTCPRAIMGFPAFKLDFIRDRAKESNTVLTNVLKLLGIENGMDYVFPKIKFHHTVIGKKSKKPVLKKNDVRIVPVYMLPYIFEVCDYRVTEINKGSHICRFLEDKMQLMQVTSPDNITETHLEQLKYNTMSLLDLSKHKIHTMVVNYDTMNTNMLRLAYTVNELKREFAKMEQFVGKPDSEEPDAQTPKAKQQPEREEGSNHSDEGETSPESSPKRRRHDDE